MDETVARLLVESYRLMADLTNGDPPYSQDEIRKFVSGNDDLIGRIRDTLADSGIEPEARQAWEVPEVLFCANCETEAVSLIEVTNTPLCATCVTAYNWGQANPSATFKGL